MHKHKYRAFRIAPIKSSMSTMSVALFVEQFKNVVAVICFSDLPELWTNLSPNGQRSAECVWITVLPVGIWLLPCSFVPFISCKMVNCNYICSHLRISTVNSNNIILIIIMPMPMPMPIPMLLLISSLCMFAYRSVGVSLNINWEQCCQCFHQFNDRRLGTSSFILSKMISFSLFLFLSLSIWKSTVHKQSKPLTRRIIRLHVAFLCALVNSM